MKKILIMLLSAALICSASACAQGGNQNSPEQAQTTSESETTAPEETTAEAGITPLMWKVTDAEGHTAYMLGSAHFADEKTERNSPDEIGADKPDGYDDADLHRQILYHI